LGQYGNINNFYITPMSRNLSMTTEQKSEIDAMPQIAMARLWRFAEDGHPLLSGETGKYFSQVFNSRGGMTTEISKALGWGR
jgi:hypothetical protein